MEKFPLCAARKAAKNYFLKGRATKTSISNCSKVKYYYCHNFFLIIFLHLYKFRSY